MRHDIACMVQDPLGGLLGASSGAAAARSSGGSQTLQPPQSQMSADPFSGVACRRLWQKQQHDF